MGKANAATTTAILLGSSEVDLADAYVLSVGIAGVSPEVGTLGSVFIADAVVDWDHKYRLDPTEATPTGLLPYRRRDPVHRLNDDLVRDAARAVEGLPLADDARLDSIRDRYDHDAARSSPRVGVGTTASSDEYWHGSALADRVQWFLDEYGAGKLCTTQMEDYGTATALARFGRLDRYLSVRAGVNFDRPPRNASSRESFDESEGSVELSVGLENAFRVGSAIVEHLVGPGE
jgi:purine nucleoside permease